MTTQTFLTFAIWGVAFTTVALDAYLTYVLIKLRRQLTEKKATRYIALIAFSCIIAANLLINTPLI